MLDQAYHPSTLKVTPFIEIRLLTTLGSAQSRADTAGNDKGLKIQPIVNHRLQKETPQSPLRSEDASYFCRYAPHHKHRSVATSMATDDLLVTQRRRGDRRRCGGARGSAVREGFVSLRRAIQKLKKCA
ncbi:hypothetical protein E2542_SST03970 [Spatholobus suberectus]|nr:hypothetical protein E2542_SST03970 [Spatholobus suberectus]